MAPRSLRKKSLCYKTGKSLGEDLIYISKGEKVYNSKFSKVTILRERKSRTHIQLETYLNLNETEGNIAAVLVNYNVD